MTSISLKDLRVSQRVLLPKKEDVASNRSLTDRRVAKGPADVFLFLFPRPAAFLLFPVSARLETQDVKRTLHWRSSLYVRCKIKERKRREAHGYYILNLKRGEGCKRREKSWMVSMMDSETGSWKLSNGGNGERC